ncbi:MAG: LysR family transcriptional regulator [Rhodobacterales bacterium]|nr:MAG: LysR family transcriptional regulator [Rhodobacterales bacterium]
MLYITLRQYEYVVAVADTGSLTHAAARLNVSQPSLSVALSRVEDAVGQKIFLRRKGAALMVTPFGHRFIAKARALLDSAGRIEQGDAKQHLVLGCFADIAPWYLAPAIKALQSRFAGVSVRGVEGRFSELAANITEGTVDLAITYDIGFEGPFVRRKLKEVTPVAFLACDHPLAGQETIRLDQLADHPVILFHEELSQGYMQKLFDALHLLPNVAHRAGSLEMMRSLAAHGAGIGISYSCPPGNVSYDGTPLVTRPISTPHASADIILLWSELRATDKRFSEMLETLAGQL